MPLSLRALLLLCFGAMLGASLSVGRGVLAEREAALPTGDLPLEQARTLAEVMERVKQDYVDSVSDRDLMEAAIRGMVSGLDPHSAF
ncbi:MAG TPA: hypothetical protein VLT59_13285, partial [Steroidobacteraceae bacterium]|nr:hypothetical protein [Steroidobacteraceae bacterium]